MIWDLLEALNRPDEYAVRIEGGEIHIARIDDLLRVGARVGDFSSFSSRQILESGNPTSEFPPTRWSPE